nr:hypothetical protein [Tanacetum cinerariifolium]
MSTFVLCVGCGEALYGFHLVNGVRASGAEMIYEMNFVRYYFVVHQPPQEETSVENLQDLENDALGNKQYKPKDIHELFRKNFNDVQIIHEELAEYINTPSWNHPIVYYDDDEHYTIAITPVLPIEGSKDSLIMEDEHLDTIPEKETDEFTNSSVEKLVLSLSESEDISDGEDDLPLCDDFPKSHLVTFSNPLFDIDNDFTSSDDESFFEEDVPMENCKIFSNPLFDLDEEIISTEVNPIQNEVLESITSIPPGIDYFDAESNLIESLLNQNTSIDSTSKIDSLLDEFAGELIFLKSIPPGIDESDFYLEGDISLIERLLYVENSIESFPHLISPDYSDSDGYNLFPARLLHDDPIPLLNVLDFSNVIRVFISFFTYPVTYLILLSSGSEDTIFDHGISNYHFSSLDPGVSHRSGTFKKFNVYPNHLNEIRWRFYLSLASLWTNEFGIESVSRLG